MNITASSNVIQVIVYLIIKCIYSDNKQMYTYLQTDHFKSSFRL